MIDTRDDLNWTEWRPLMSASRDRKISSSPGLYRLRRVGSSGLDYVGQTGLELGQRLGMLRGVFADQMPYKDPHTAAPGLWALRHATGCDFEVSVAPVEGSTPWRKGLEALAIALYRQEHGESPTVEFGRMPPGYRPSSGNNARLVKQHKRFRGGLTGERELACHIPGVPPTSPLDSDIMSRDWNGHRWTAWILLHDLPIMAMQAGSGLYRIRDGVTGQLYYVGQGRIPDRLLAHRAKLVIPEHRQGAVFARAGRLECSWVLNNEWLPHQRLELENDLIAAHVLHRSAVPVAQFLG